VPDGIVFLKGSVDSSRETPSVIVNEVVPVEKADETFAAEVRIALPRPTPGDETLAALAKVLAAFPGPCPVVIEMATREGLRARIRVGSSLFVQPGDAVAQAVEAVLGPRSVCLRGALGRDGSEAVEGEVEARGGEPTAPEESGVLAEATA